MKNIFLDLGYQPLANKFLSENEVKKYEIGEETEYSFPMKVQFDTENYLVSLVEQPSPEKMFNADYPYYSGCSATMRTHFKNAAQYIKEHFSYNKILEIGSSDGTFAQHFDKKNIMCVEPCEKQWKLLNDNKFKTAPVFWDKSSAKVIKKADGPYDLIFAANCACHVPDIYEFFEACAIALKNGGVLILEDPSVLATIRNCAYSQFYDEHHYVFSALALEKIGYEFGLRLIHIQTLPNIHMGSNRVIFEKGDYHIPSDVYPTILAEEEKFGLDKEEIYFKFAEQVRGNIERFLDILENYSKKPVIAFGATSKANTIYCYAERFRFLGVRKLINCITDTTPEKISKYTPLTHIPIVQEPKDLNEIADVVYLGAPNYQEEIMKKHSNFEGKWLTTIPYVHEVKMPANKSPEMESLLNKLAPYGFDNHQNHCSKCGRKVSENGFRNEISKREWNISRMCQICQDNFFGKD